MIDYIKMSLRNISRRRRRTLLTVIGIFIGITAVVSLVSMGLGLQSSIQKEFESIGGNKLFISSGGNFFNAGSSSSGLTDQDKIAIQSVKGVTDVSGVLMMTGSVKYQDQTAYLPVMGMPADKPGLVMDSWSLEITKGRMIRSTDRTNVVIGSRLADSIFDDSPGIRSNIEVRGKKYRVVGVFKPTGDPSIDTAVTMPIGPARELFNRDNSYDWLFADVAEGEKPVAVKQDVERALRNRRNVKEGEEDFSVTTQEDLMNSFNSILGVVSGVVIGIASISLFVGAVGIMNTMYTSVTERTREIGVMKAIGAQKRQIMYVFLLESAVIGFLGGLTGLVFGVLLSWAGSLAVSQFSTLVLRPYLSFELVAGSLLFSIVLGVASGVLPARRGANLEPAEALRYE